MLKNTTRIVLALVAVALVLPAVASAQIPIENAEAGSLAAHAAQEYRKQARYPAHSKVLPAGVEDPIRAKRTPTEVNARVPQGEVGELAVWSAKISYEVGQPIELFARPGGSKALAITGEVVNGMGDQVATLSFFDDGVGPDKVAEDGVFSARMFMTKDRRPALADEYMVRVQASFENGEVRHAVSGYLYSRPHARLTGNYRDRVVDGNLVIQAQVRVLEKARFHLAGTVHSVDGEPIGTSQNAVVLDQGLHWIDLSFYGLMFHERKAQGPYVLGSLALSTTGGMPNAWSDLAENVHTTRAVPLKSMTARPAGDADLLRAAEVLEAEAARSRGLSKN